MTRGIVTCNLYKRKGSPSVNAEKLGYFTSGEEVEILDVVLGETENDYYEGTPTWYKLTGDIYVWSGGVSLDLDEEVFKEKVAIDRITSPSENNIEVFNLREKLSKWIEFNKEDTKDIYIAVLDSGIDKKNTSLAEHIYYSEDFQNDKDLNYHGSSVAGILVGKTAFLEGLCDARIIDLRVVRKNKTTDDYAVFKALEFVTDWNKNKEKPPLKIVNMSLDVRLDTIPYIEPLILNLIKNNTTIIASGTKYGHYKTEIAKIPGVITVGTFEKGEEHLLPSGLSMAFLNEKIPSIGIFPERVFFKDSSAYAAITTGIISNFLAKKPKASQQDINNYIFQICSPLNASVTEPFKPYRS